MKFVRTKMSTSVLSPINGGFITRDPLVKFLTVINGIPGRLKNAFSVTIVLLFITELFTGRVVPNTTIL